MSFSFDYYIKKSLKSTIPLLLYILVQISVAQAQTPGIILTVENTFGYPGETEIPVSIYLDNYIDSISAFQFRIDLDRTDLITFNCNSIIVPDTTYWLCLNWLDSITCLDSLEVLSDGSWDFFHIDTNLFYNTCFLDTINTLVSRWEFLDGRTLAGDGYDLSITGIADLPYPPITPPILPQQGGTLIKMLVNVMDVPDSMTNRTVEFSITYNCFSDPNANCIGMDSVVLDTTCYVCTMWLGDSCLNWVEAPEPPCDSIFIGPDTTIYFDSTYFAIINGSFTVLMPDTCGYIDNGPWTIADLVYLVDYMFNDGPPLGISDADCDCNCTIDIADLICFVDFMFYNGSPPGCGK